ncbi:MAG TPA: alpha/beta hydrolase-fold protein [Candidatus Acidoferrum sp.]|nr:alpha/beta hydrolase-fold protein [Candidatus Acidoferrum sp.]
MPPLCPARIAAVLAGVCVLAGGCASRPAHEQPPPSQSGDNEYKIGERHTLHSGILNENRPYWVYLPRSYGEELFAPKKYPVLYLLDGDAHFHSASGVVDFMGGGINGNMQIPELIIVAIPNTSRTRDLTPTHTTRDATGKEEPSFASSGGGEAFLDFIDKELMPQIEREYRTMPFRILVGHSLGGLFAMNALLHRPPIFQAFIAIDPSLQWDDQVVLRRTKQMLEKTNDFRGHVYVSIANNPPSKDFDPSIPKNACLDFAHLLEKNNSPVFRSSMQYFEAENHGSVPLLSLYYGLLFIFDGYKPPGSMMNNPGLLSEHFAKVSERLGVQFLPPEETVNSYGNYFMYDEQAADKAIEYFKVNAAGYPDSFNAYDRLARAYDMNGNAELAQTNYVRMLELNRNRWADEPDRWGSTVHALLRVLKLQSNEQAIQPFLAEWLGSPAGNDAKGQSLARLRGDVCARSGHWPEAAAEFSEMVKLEPTNHLYYHALAPLLVASGDLRGYRRHCAAELRRFSGTRNPSIAERMAKDCLFVPSSGADLQSLSKWADTAVVEGSTSPDLPYFQFAKGLAEYRRGQFTSASDWTQKVIRAGGVTFRNAEAYLVLAMAQHQLKNDEQARISLAKGVEIIKTTFPKLEDGDLGDAWIDWIMAQSLMKEAETLVGS